MSKRPFQPKREDVRADELDYYDRVVQRQANYGYARPTGEEAGQHFGALLQAPFVADVISELGVYYRNRGEEPDSFTHAQREWTDMVIGKDLHAGIFWNHMLDAVASGVRREAIRAIWEGRDWDLDREELMLTSFVRQVVNGSVTPQSFDAIEELLGVRGAVEYTAWICHLQLTARLIGAHRPGPMGTWIEMAEERLQSIIDGTAQIPSGPRVAAKI